MAHVIFYEKPGCINNTRQKKMLIDAGHQLDVRNLLAEKWEEAQLRRYFEGLAVEQWINRSAPAIKSGQINLQTLTEDAAIKLMIDEPLLIRRPLLRVGEVYMTGFNLTRIDDWIGLKVDNSVTDMETCPRDRDDINKCDELT